MSSKRNKSIVCAVSILIGLLSSAPAHAIGWGYNPSYYGSYGRNYFWWPGTWWVPASYAQMVLGFPYRYFTQQTPMPASAYPALSLHRTNNRYYDSYNTAGIPPYENMSQYEYQQWLLQNGYTAPAQPPAGYASNQHVPYPQRSQPPVAEEAANQGSQFLYNTYGPNTQLPTGPDYQRNLTVDPGYFRPNGKPRKQRHAKNEDAQVAENRQPNSIAQVPWHYEEPTTPPPVQMAGAYYASGTNGDPDSFIRTLNSKYSSNMSAALFDPNTRQLAHSLGLIDNDDLFDVDLSDQRVNQMKGILQNSRMPSPEKIQALHQMLEPTSVATGNGNLSM